MERELLKEKTIDKNTKGRTYSFLDYLICEIEYMGGRLMISKNYQNTFDGRKQLDSFLKSIKSGKDVEEYFNIKGGLKMSLESVVEEIRKNNKFAKEVIDGGNPSTLVSRQARQKSAKERLKQLYTQYVGQLKTRSIFVVVNGDGAEEFSKLAAEKAGFHVGDAERFYGDLTDRIDSRLYKNPVRSAYVIDVMSRHFEDMANELNVIKYNQIISSNKLDAVIKTRDDVLALTQKVINTIVGSEISGLYVFEKLAKQAFDSEFEDKIFPVMVLASKENFADIAQGLKKLNPRVFTVTAGENGLDSAAIKVADVNAKTVLATLTKIKKEITGNSPKGKANE